MKSLRLIGTDADTTYPESAIIQTAQWAAESGHVYPSLAAKPYTPAPYGPLFYIVLARMADVVGNDANRLRLLLRSMVFLSYFLTGLVAYSLARRTGAPALTAALTAVAVWGVPFALNWNISVRPDFPALLLSLMGIWFASRSKARGPGMMIASAICCAAAPLTKQVYIAAALAIAVLLVRQRRFRSLAYFATAGAVTGLAVVGYLLFRGEPVLKHLLVIGHSPLSPRSGLSYLSDLFIGLGILVVAGGVASLLSREAAKRPAAALLKLYFLFAFPVALLTLLQVGSNNNYVLEVWAILCIAAASSLPRAETVWATLTPSFQVGALIAFLFLAVQGLHQIMHSPAIYRFNFDRLGNLRIFSTDPSLTAHGSKPEFLDPFLMAILEQQKVVSVAGIHDQIRRQEYDVVVTDETGGELNNYHGQPLLSRALQDSVAVSYLPFCRTSNKLVLRPRTRVVLSLEDASYTLREPCVKIVPEELMSAINIRAGSNRGNGSSESEPRGGGLVRASAR